MEWLDVKSQILGYVGLINLQNGNTDLLMDISSKLDSLVVDINNWTIPINHYFKANLSIFENNKELAEDYISDAESDNEFEKKNLIQSYINRFKYNLTKLK